MGSSQKIVSKWHGVIHKHSPRTERLSARAFCQVDLAMLKQLRWQVFLDIKSEIVYHIFSQNLTLLVQYVDDDKRLSVRSALIAPNQDGTISAFRTAIR